jgi:hypothetical protein
VPTELAAGIESASQAQLRHENPQSVTTSSPAAQRFSTGGAARRLSDLEQVQQGVEGIERGAPPSRWFNSAEQVRFNETARQQAGGRGWNTRTINKAIIPEDGAAEDEIQRPVMEL